MAERPLVSIVPPSFNQATYLEEAMRSVLDQDYLRVEYILIDGGSTDGSPEIIKRYAKRLSFWTSESDRGQADAINRGFVNARGKYMAWLNADDRLKTNAISEAVAFLESHPDVGMVYGDADFIDAQGRAIGRS